MTPPEQTTQAPPLLPILHRMIDALPYIAYESGAERLLQLWLDYTSEDTDMPDVFREVTGNRRAAEPQVPVGDALLHHMIMRPELDEAASTPAPSSDTADRLIAAIEGPNASAPSSAIEEYGNCENPGHVIGLSSPHRRRSDCVDFRLPQPVPDPHVLPARAPSSGGITQVAFHRHPTSEELVVRLQDALVLEQDRNLWQRDAEALERDRDKLYKLSDTALDRIKVLEQELAAARQERDEEIASKVRKIFECADLTVQLKVARQEHAALVAGLREIHSRDSKPKGGWCGECDTEYPCRTAALLPPVTNGE